MEDHDQLPKLDVTIVRPEGAPDRKAPIVMPTEEPQEETEE